MLTKNVMDKDFGYVYITGKTVHIVHDIIFNLLEHICNHGIFYAQ